jgi:hypothetical protein
MLNILLFSLKVDLLRYSDRQESNVTTKMSLMIKCRITYDFQELVPI